MQIEREKNNYKKCLFITESVKCTFLYTQPIGMKVIYSTFENSLWKLIQLIEEIPHIHFTFNYHTNIVFEGEITGNKRSFGLNCFDGKISFLMKSC